MTPTTSGTGPWHPAIKFGFGSPVLINPISYDDEIDAFQKALEAVQAAEPQALATLKAHGFTEKQTLERDY